MTGVDNLYFEYGKKEIDHLKSRDKKLGEAIEQIGHIQRAVEDDLFSSIVRTIIGQQISTAAQTTLWNRLTNRLGNVSANSLLSLSREELQSIGITFKKTDYIRNFAEKVADGSFEIGALAEMPDEKVIKELSLLQGVGIWTAEMILTFCMQRPNILSYGDLAIQRGMRMLYRHRSIDKEKFEKYRRRYKPHGTVASLYLWAIAGGAIPALSDPAAKKAKN